MDHRWHWYLKIIFINCIRNFYFIVVKFQYRLEIDVHRLAIQAFIQGLSIIIIILLLIESIFILNNSMNFEIVLELEFRSSL